MLSKQRRQPRERSVSGLLAARQCDRWDSGMPHREPQPERHGEANEICGAPNSEDVEDILRAKAMLEGTAWKSKLSLFQFRV